MATNQLSNTFFDIEMPTFDTVIGYLPVLICLLLVWWIYSARKNVIRRVENYRRHEEEMLIENKQLRENIDAQKSKIAELTVRLETQSKLIADQQKNSSANQFPTRNDISIQPPTNLSKSVAPSVAPPPPPAEFVDEYNGLKNLQGDNLRNGINNFIKKYAVKCFFCEDVRKHANSFQVLLPTHLPHSFVESRPNRFFNCWLYMSSDGRIVVVPALFVTSYTDSLLCESEKVTSTLFDLKSVGGRPYVEFFVEKPAILNIFWEIEQKGSVKLLDYESAVRHLKEKISNLEQSSDYDKNESANSPIVAKYNKLIGLTGVEFKRARDDFRREYEVKAFKCGNVEARMNNHNIPPDFVDDSINGNGNYWAVPSDAASFYVFPNVRVYNDNLHNDRAMGIVFDSNFQSGRTYEKISVKSPAKFKRNGTDWILESKGQLILE